MVYWCDTSHAIFQPGVDVGNVVMGTLSVRAVLLREDQWVPLKVHPEDDPHGEDALAFVERRSSSPARAARMQAMRARIGKTLAQAQGDVLGLTGLRLLAGMSQQQLAERMQTQQPSVARWERDPSGMKVETLLRLARVLEMEFSAVAKAVGAQVESQNHASPTQEELSDA